MIWNCNTTKILHLRYEDDASVSSTSEISLHFLNISIALHNLMTKLDHCITTFHQSAERFPRLSSLLNKKESGLDERKSFCKTLSGGTDLRVSFEETLATVLK